MWERLFVEALLRDAILADAVWELWYAGLIDDGCAELAWLTIAGVPRKCPQ